MKQAKKLLAVLLTVALLAAVLPAAFATTPAPAVTTYTLTIENTPANRTYDVYQLFTGELSGAANGSFILSDVKYGASWQQTGVTAGDTVDATTLETFEKNTAEQNLDAFLASYKGSPFKTVTTTAPNTTVDGLTPGYYVVVESSSAIEEGGIYAKSIVQVLGNVTVKTKVDAPSSYKKVTDANDSGNVSGHDGDLNDSADYDIGDAVPFALRAVLPENFRQYRSAYPMTFHDVQSPGLTFDDSSVSVYVLDKNGQKWSFAASEYTVDTAPTDSCTFHVTITDLKAPASGGTPYTIQDGDTVCVDFNATLNDNAKIGPDGNPNTMHITFSNNPNVDTPNDEGKTPDDKVTVFTYKLVVNKTEPDQDPAQPNKALEGAGFTLYKFDSKANDYKEVKVIAPADGLTQFTFTGLDAGKYKLVESVTPKGYNTINPIEFTVEAEHDALSDDPKLTKLVCKGADGTDYTTDMATGTITMEVLNAAGSTLPSTGGTGTTIFYVIGSVLAVGAAILLISKKRMHGVQ